MSRQLQQNLRYFTFYTKWTNPVLVRHAISNQSVSRIGLFSILGIDISRNRLRLASVQQFLAVFQSHFLPFMSIADSAWKTGRSEWRWNFANQRMGIFFYNRVCCCRFWASDCHVPNGCDSRFGLLVSDNGERLHFSYHLGLPQDIQWSRWFRMVKVQKPNKVELVAKKKRK